MKPERSSAAGSKTSNVEPRSRALLTLIAPFGQAQCREPPPSPDRAAHEHGSEEGVKSSQFRFRRSCQRRHIVREVFPIPPTGLAASGGGYCGRAQKLSAKEAQTRLFPTV
jgi:hypothetical protein